ncbi:MAG: hypothetical protein INF88_00930 [Roseomonas sp.]|nr:hypothetical protein [Roseomonas sp.]
MTQRNRIAVKDVQEILMSTGEWARIVMVADNAAAPDDLRGLCINVRDTVRQATLIRMDDPQIAARMEAALAMLVGAGLISPETSAAVLALADAPAGGGDALTVRLVKGHVIPRTGLVVLNTGDYRLDALVDCARADAPDVSYGAFLASVIVEASA